MRTGESAVDYFEKKEGRLGCGLMAIRSIPAGTTLFGLVEWEDEEEKNIFTVLSPEELDALDGKRRSTFIHFAYNIGPTKIEGTFHPERVRHPSNFINHSCAGNLGYDGQDHIVALADIRPGEGLTMDYGTYTFSFDHEFICRCGAPNCRGRVTRDDWKELIYARGFGFPSFMHHEIRERLKLQPGRDQKKAPHMR